MVGLRKNAKRFGTPAFSAMAVPVGAVAELKPQIDTFGVGQVDHAFLQASQIRSQDVIQLRGT
jgi:hypothetical protein